MILEPPHGPKAGVNRKTREDAVREGWEGGE